LLEDLLKSKKKKKKKKGIDVGLGIGPVSDVCLYFGMNPRPLQV
jgi:hypothetical protein